MRWNQTQVVVAEQFKWANTTELHTFSEKSSQFRVKLREDNTRAASDSGTSSVSQREEGARGCMFPTTCHESFQTYKEVQNIA